jgi:hypothetical protein
MDAIIKAQIERAQAARVKLNLRLAAQSGHQALKTDSLRIAELMAEATCELGSIR